MPIALDSVDTIDHEHTNNIVCPYCGWEDRDSWEHDDNDDGPVECGNCDCSFTVETHRTVTYTTKRLQCRAPHTWGKPKAYRITEATDARICAGSRVLKPEGAHTIWVRTCSVCEHKDFATTAFDGACPWTDDKQEAANAG